MISRLAARVFGALLCVAGPALAQSPAADDDSWKPDSPVAAAPQHLPAVQPPSPKRVSTGTCIILKGEQVIDQQNCRALAASEDTANGTAAAGFANGMTYVWPSGNRTVVGGAEDEFSVNGNAAVPLPDDGRGLCLRVDKTGNTFCYKDGAKVKAAAVKPAPPPVPPAPVEAKRTPSGTAVAGATMATSPATATASAETASLADEIRLRKLAEDEVKTLKLEISKLNEVHEKQLTELADHRKTAEAEEKKKAEAEKARIDAALKEIDDLKAKCSARDAGACERAIALAREASVTGSVNSAEVSELQQLHALAVAPLGIDALAFLGEVPPSTMVSSSVAAILALMLLAMMARRPRTAELPPLTEAGVTLPSLDMPPPPPMPRRPSLDPFTAHRIPDALPASQVPELPEPEPIAIATAPPTVVSAEPPRVSPPPIPAFPSMTAMFPAKEG